MLILAIGDLYIPERAIDIPNKFKKLLQPNGKIDKVLCLGNITNSNSTLNFLKNISNDFQLIKGEDDIDLTLPQSLVLNCDNLKIGLINGFQIIPKNDPLSLLNHARMMDVDILIYGSTHKVEAYTLDGKFFINPGTGTGAYSTDHLDKDDRLIISKIIDNKLKLNTKSKLNKDKEVEKEEEKGEEKVSKDETQKVQQPIDDNDKITQSNESKSESTTENNKSEKVDQVDTVDPVKPIEPPTLDELQLHDIDEYMEPFPSFCLLDVKDATCTLYLYTLVDGEVKIDKLVYTKDQ